MEYAFQVIDTLPEAEFGDLLSVLQSAVRRVWTQLGGGFNETIYQSALEAELRASKVFLESQVTTTVIYRDSSSFPHVVGFVRPDLLLHTKNLSHRCVVELKAVATANTKDHFSQLGVYMNLLSLDYGMLVNFPKHVNFCDDVVYEPRISILSRKPMQPPFQID